MGSELTIWLHNNPYHKKTEAKPHSDAILQQLLKNTLNTSEPVKIFKNKNGKPYVKEPIFFSHTNSQNLYAYVISTQADIGIDVEFIKPQRPYMQLAKRYFSGDEKEILAKLDDSHQMIKFFQLWTQKEAWCKLDGGNLWSYLNRSVLQHNLMTNQTGTHIHMKHINQITGFTCAVASTQVFDHFWINSIG